MKNQVYQSFQVVREMLIDRNILSQEEKTQLFGYGPNEITTYAKNNIFNIDIGETVRIIYYLSKFRINDFKEFINKTKGEKTFQIYIIITMEKLTTNNLKAINDMDKAMLKEEVIESPLNMQFFELKETQFNITKHTLVPKHTVIKDEDEINEIVQRYNLKSKLHLPLILKTDPVSRYYDIKPGQLVKVVRVSPSAGEYIVYRCCV
jgi:DNA-directed RNA polymerase subunit H (RpoH/RPB5)